MIARAAVGEFAFIKNDMGEIEGRAHKSAVLGEKGGDRPGGPIEPCQRYMRDESTRFHGNAHPRRHAWQIRFGVTGRMPAKR